MRKCGGVFAPGTDIPTLIINLSILPTATQHLHRMKPTGVKQRARHSNYLVDNRRTARLGSLAIGSMLEICDYLCVGMCNKHKAHNTGSSVVLFDVVGYNTRPEAEAYFIENYKRCV